MKINFLRNNSGQNLVEYLIVIGIVVVALAAMQTHLKRGIQASIKIVADKMGEQEGGVDPLERTTSEIHRLDESQLTTKLSSGGGEQHIIGLDKSQVLRLDDGMRSYSITEEWEE